MELVSPYAGVESPEEAAKITARCRRLTPTSRLLEISRPLDITVEELPGTVWRNVYTRDLMALEDDMRGFGPDGFVCPFIYMEIEGHLLVDHSIRVDHLSIKQQREWYLAHISQCHSQVSDARRSLRQFNEMTPEERARVSCWAANKSIAEDGVAWELERLNLAKSYLVEFDESHGTITGITELNTGIQPGEQAVMFGGGI